MANPQGSQAAADRTRDHGTAVALIPAGETIQSGFVAR
jgi:hypothetical protein